ncbi:Z1 domain-containing protein [Actinoplanes sp. NPDC051494]|uniref:Z1 domain-containing protein n=1 Tax=Actinoplanes sp. NPDC051494 TaxID=3363907 RepID=UPI00378C3B51
MNEPLVSAYLSALGAMVNGPKAIVRRATLEAEDLGLGIDVSEDRLREYVIGAGPNDELRVQLHLRLATWDHAAIAPELWMGDTRPNTKNRRALITKLLGLGDKTAAEFADYFSVATDDDTVIAGEWEPWYTADVQRERDYYWSNYINYLRTQRKWGAPAISALNGATSRVVERLTNPAQRAPAQTKGLVVGYVQSGKTANFAGVIAKSIDAGYRLIIVMTGTTNLLREQTQRRLDMELVGRENILRGADENGPDATERIDYIDDQDWIDDRFNRFGVRPLTVGKPEIRRMTTRRFDYRSLQQGLPALEFERANKSEPVWHPDNLYSTDARLIVVKKNATVLKNLIADLKSNADRLDDIPALIIDDESDQASINTVDPDKQPAGAEKERTAINERISTLLRMLPRAQYVGYTATPFANVFADYTDKNDVFPSNYILALRRPVGYMGVDDFHDIDSSVPESERTFANSKEEAHVRLLGAGDDEQELRRALDSFVLTGAIKLHRRGLGIEDYKHHTMLVHEAAKKLNHKLRRDAVRELWTTAGYYQSTGRERLRSLFERDFAPVSQGLNLGYPMPPSFAELEPLITRVVREIAPNGDPVLVINSDKELDQEELDFDRRPVWRILVGGNKLARGFTVEGLTITYYARTVGHTEALMQMGRWFGFRPGYRDLVRLFITPKIRDYFESACRDEEQFREELRQFAVMADGRPLVTPEEIQPLVARHGLRPTAANKMRYTQLVERRSLSKEPSSGYPELGDTAKLKKNIAAVTPLLRAASTLKTLTTATGKQFEALVGKVPQAEMVEVLKQLQWRREDTFKADLAWIEGLEEKAIDQWIVVLPQSGRRVNITNVGEVSLHGRKVENESVRGNSESLHREALTSLADRTPTTGCAIVYPVINKERGAETLTGGDWPADVVMAFRLELPEKALPAGTKPLVYKSVAKRHPLSAEENS